ncbi:spore coat protein YsxE [Metabacillus halosaccharovorans]|uniref:spore coat protein YsxE n=1 Tax=Metabacillus halosaccharovorans TaxID=930124 RepID=UPI00403DF852
MQQLSLSEIRPLLHDYNLSPEYTEDLSKKAIKIYTDTGPFVLKKLSKGFNPYFVDSLRILKDNKYSHHVPLVSNNQQQLLSYYKGDYYYLMPWLSNEQEEERDARHQYLFKEVATLHKKTEKKLDISTKDVSNHYEETVKRWDQAKEMYEAFVEQCEQKIYLSPFELQAVTYYTEVSRAIDFSKKKLEEWSNLMEEEKATRVVLIHGKISAHHFLYDDNGNGYITNFERSKYASPIDDFLLFMNRTATTYPIQSDDCVNWFYTYQKGYPYTAEEMSLFLSYLAYPDRICHLIKTYNKEKKKRSELDRNKQLVKAYWQFKNVEYFVMKVSEIEEKKKMEAEEQS